MADPRFSQLPRGTVEDESGSVDSSQLPRVTVDDVPGSIDSSQLPRVTVDTVNAGDIRHSQLAQGTVEWEPAAGAIFSQMVRVVIEEFVQEAARARYNVFIAS